MEDPRTIFYLPADKQVIVYFEWEGPLGLHKFEGYWKNSEGKTAVFSEFSYEAKDKRFGAYWTLALSETMPTGLWSLEARVDGEVTGTHAFQVLAAAKPTDAMPAPRPLALAEMYKLAVDSTVFIEKYDANGNKYSTGSGFLLGENTVATAFQVIDGASALQVVLPSGQRAESKIVLAWNRRQDWALLDVTAPKMPHLERAEKNSWSVGDACFGLDSPNEGGRTLQEASVIGIQDRGEAGPRLTFSFSPSPSAVGGPLLNEYGKVIGVIGGALVPGASTLEGLRFGYPANLVRTGGILQGVLAVPVHVLSLAGARQATLEELSRTGQFIPLLTAQRHIMSGTLSMRVDRKLQIPRPIDERYEFSPRDAQFFAIIGWNPKEKRKAAMTVLNVYDIDNHPRIKSAPGKVSLDPDKIFFQDLKIPLQTLAPGIYRLELFIDGEAAWRTFFRVVE